MSKDPKPTKASPAPLTTSIHIALANIMRDIRAVEKDRQNQAQNFMFRGIDDVLNALHPIFAAHGVVVLPKILETTFDRTEPNAKGNRFFVARVKTEYVFVASDGTKESAVGAGEGYDQADKALNKAQSAAYKYVLIQMFQIPTADLVDADAYDPTVDPRAAADPYGAQPLNVLEGLRDEIIKTGTKPDAALLGRIAVLKAEAADAAMAAPTTTAAPAQQAAAAADKPKAEKPPKKAKEEKPKEEPPKPAETKTADVPPGAAGFEEPELDAAPAAGSGKEAAMNAAMALAISPEAIKHPDYVGKKLAQLDADQIESLYQNWVLKFPDQIKASPVKVALRDAVTLIRESLPKKPA